LCPCTKLGIDPAELHTAEALTADGVGREGSSGLVVDSYLFVFKKRKRYGTGNAE
jgi:hypothetical protein